MQRPISVVNKSSIRSVTNQVVDLMTRGVALQLQRDVAPNLVIGDWVLAFYPDEKLAPAGSEMIYVFDHADQAGALGYHAVDPQGNPYGRVFVQDTIDAGGTVNESPVCVATCLGHEVIELVKDQGANQWAMKEDGTLIAMEPGDPVESDAYQTELGSDKTWLTNFVWESWFVETGLGLKQFDQLGKLKTPFEMTPGGYMIVGDESGIHQVFGRDYPEWRKKMKSHPASRTQRRLHGNLGRLLLKQVEV